MLQLKFFLLVGLLVVSAASHADQRPNIVLILADDLGFTDIEPYGSEVRTPTLSQLAAAGLRFSNYHTAATCAPTRAMLLTGVDSHRAGVANIPEAIPGSQRGEPGYAGVLSQNVVTIASLLREAGYRTSMSGKWHLGKTPENLPDQRGFERSLALADTGADNWEQKPYLPMYKTANWFLDGKPHQLPKDFYSSRYIVDKAMEFIDEQRDTGQPFFAYIAFQAVHIPVQAPAEFSARYREQYQAGWQALRKQRAEAARKLGLIPADAPMANTPEQRDWQSLSEAERRQHAQNMAVYAGMIEAMDHHLGRLVAYLKTTGEYDNTVFVFASDNGPEGSDPLAQVGWPLALWLRSNGYDANPETPGTRGSFVYIGPDFASAAASPLAYYKFHAGEGGMRVPMIIAGPGVAQPGSLSNALSYVTDIVPTLLELTGVQSAAEEFEPISGRSLLPILRGERERVRTDTDVIGYELGGNAALFQGDYKIVFNRGPLGDSRWRLYNIARDPGETRDLSAREPRRLQTMLAHYEDYVRDNGVLPVSDNYDQLRQVSLNGLKARSSELIVPAVVVVSIIVAWLLFRRRQTR